MPVTLGDIKQQAVGSIDEVIREGVKEALKNVHTSIPGIIQSFDATKQTVEVQPAVMRRFSGDSGPVSLPLCVDVPVVIPGGGGFFMTFPVASGDECLLMFAERCIDEWWRDGDVSAPAQIRFHDLSDGFALIGPLSLGRVIPNYSTSAVELRNRLGTSKIQLSDAGVNIIGTLRVNGTPLIVP